METRVCKGPCGLELPMSKFRREVKFKFVKSANQIKERISYRCVCKSCINKLMKPSTVEKHRLRTKIWRRTEGAKTTNRARHKLYVEALSIGYVRTVWSQNKEHLNIPFPEELYEQEVIRLKARRAVEKAYKQFKLNKDESN